MPRFDRIFRGREGWRTVVDESPANPPYATALVEGGFVTGDGNQYQLRDRPIVTNDSLAPDVHSTVSATSVPVNVAPGDAVVTMSVLSLNSKPAPSTRVLDIVTQVVVGNVDGTDVIRVSAGAVAGVDDTGVAVDWTTATVVPVAGTDLDWDGDNHQVVSAAGGAFTTCQEITWLWD